MAIQGAQRWANPKWVATNGWGMDRVAGKQNVGCRHVLCALCLARVGASGLVSERVFGEGGPCDGLVCRVAAASCGIQLTYLDTSVPRQDNLSVCRLRPLQCMWLVTQQRLHVVSKQQCCCLSKLKHRHTAVGAAGAHGKGWQPVQASPPVLSCVLCTSVTLCLATPACRVDSQQVLQHSYHLADSCRQT